MSQTFAELGLNPDLTAGLESLGFEAPTKLQAETVPHLLAGRDAVIEAMSGSGKTLSYVLPILQTLNADAEGVQAIIIAESGNDATRIAGVFQQLATQKGLHVVPVRSGQPIARETERLTADTAIVVGTANRLNGHFEQETFGLDTVQFVVLDGANTFLNKEKGELIEGILDKMPPSRQTVVFAAELNEAVQNLTDQHLFEPAIIKRTTSDLAMPVIKHRYQSVSATDKDTVLAKLMDSEAIEQAILFANTRTEALRLTNMLKSVGYTTATIHAATDNSEKESIVRNWQEGNIALLVLTDAATTGLAVDAPIVISTGVPSETEKYAVRTGFVAEMGTHLSLVTARERRLFSEIETFIGQRIKAVLPPTRASSVVQRAESFKQRIRDIIKKRNLEVYMLLMNDLAEEGFDWAELAAAATSLAQYAQENAIFTRRTERRSTSQPTSRYRSSSQSSSYRDRGRSSDRGSDRGRDRDRGGDRKRSRPSRDRDRDENREVESGYLRLVMDAGYDISVRPKDIVGAIANEANIPGRAVGNIDIRDRFTFVEIQDEYAERVLTRVPSTRLRGRIVTFRRA